MATAKQRAWRKKFAQKYSHKRSVKPSQKKSENTMARRSRTRTVTRYIKSGYRRRGGARGILGSGRSILNKALIGFGAIGLASLIAPKIGISPQVVGAGLGYVGGGAVGALTAFAVPYITSVVAPQGQSMPSGQVWV